jgi:hypothetical protein
LVREREKRKKNSRLAEGEKRKLSSNSYDVFFSMLFRIEERAHFLPIAMIFTEIYIQ